MHLTEITDLIRKDECVLLLGPWAAEHEGKRLRDLLCDYIHLKSLERNYERSTDTQDLSVAISNYLKSFNDTGVALDSLRHLMKDFYLIYKDRNIPVYDTVAELPFKYIINTAPDNLIVNAMSRRFKNPRFFDFNFDNPVYNDTQNEKAIHLEREIAEESPLIFNLLGHYDRSDSLVLTDGARLRFLEVVLQREKEATLPANIAFFFNRQPINHHRKAFIFIGFDFNEWHMRLFMHLLRRHHKNLPHSVSLQSKQNLIKDTQNFFHDNFNMHFVEANPLKFLEELKAELRAPIPPPSIIPSELLILYDHHDEQLRDKVEVAFSALRQENLVDIWHMGKINPSESIEASLNEKLHRAILIVPMVTNNLIANDRLFNEILPIAMKRHKSGDAILAPIIMSPCDISNTYLFELFTIYPKPRGKSVSEHSDFQAALLTIADDFRRMIKLKIQKQNS